MPPPPPQTDELTSYAPAVEMTAGISEMNGVRTGDKATLPEWEWVNPVNAPSIRQKFSNIPYTVPMRQGDVCGVDFGGRATVRGFDAISKQAFVDYAPAKETGGTHCPAGTLFLIDTGAFKSLQASYETKAFEIEKNRQEVQSIVDGESKISSVGTLKKGDAFLLTGRPGWVDVQNPTPVTQHFSNAAVQLGQGEHCILETGGAIMIVGFAKEKDKALVEYQTMEAPMGTPCPAGVLYWMSVADMRGALEGGDLTSLKTGQAKSPDTKLVL